MMDPADVLRQAPSISTARLRLRPLRSDDAEAMFDFFRDAETMRFWSSPPHVTPRETGDMIERARVSHLAAEGIEFAITRPDGDRAIGKIGHWRWQRAHSRSEVGFILRRDLWGQGLAAEALGAVVDWGFTRLGLHSVEAQLDFENIASRRTLERVGFRLEGRTRQSYFDGRQFRDTLVYGLLRSERPT